MKNLITQDLKHLLWKDEIGDPFLLLNYGEVYKYDKNTLRLLAWSREMCARLRQKGVILNERSYDDRLYALDIDRFNLALLIQLGAFKRRPHKNGKWIKHKEELLGHRIIPYRATLKENAGGPKVQPRRNESQNAHEGKG
jgi:hypothetical protein